MKLSDKLFYTIMHLLPPRDKAVSVMKCRNCGKLRLMGDLHNEKRRHCPRCNGSAVIVPKDFSFRDKMDYLWAALFRRKVLLFGIDEGVHWDRDNPGMEVQ